MTEDPKWVWYDEHATVTAEQWKKLHECLWPEGVEPPRKSPREQASADKIDRAIADGTIAGVGTHYRPRR